MSHIKIEYYHSVSISNKRIHFRIFIVTVLVFITAASCNDIITQMVGSVPDIVKSSFYSKPIIKLADCMMKKTKQQGLAKMADRFTSSEDEDEIIIWEATVCSWGYPMIISVAVLIVLSLIANIWFCSRLCFKQKKNSQFGKVNTFGFT